MPSFFLEKLSITLPKMPINFAKDRSTEASYGTQTGSEVYVATKALTQ